MQVQKNGRDESRQAEQSYMIQGTPGGRFKNEDIRV